VYQEVCSMNWLSYELNLPVELIDSSRKKDCCIIPGLRTNVVPSTVFYKVFTGDQNEEVGMCSLWLYL